MQHRQTTYCDTYTVYEDRGEEEKNGVCHTIGKSFRVRSICAMITLESPINDAATRCSTGLAYLSIIDIIAEHHLYHHHGRAASAHNVVTCIHAGHSGLYTNNNT
jgi:hypothetical protein